MHLNERDVELIEVDFLLPEQLLVRGQLDDEIGHKIPDPRALGIVYGPPSMLNDIFQNLQDTVVLSKSAWHGAA